jgi:type VI secretion system secreted protein Hcp
MAVDMFIKLTNIEGESVDKVHKGEIDVLAWSWGASQSGSAHVGGGAGAGKVNVNDLSFTKWVDKASPVLMKHVCTGQHIAECKLVVRKAGGSPIEYIIITMKEVLITSLSTGGSGGEDRLTENVTLNFAMFQLDYVPQAAAGTAEAAITATWNIQTNNESIS